MSCDQYREALSANLDGEPGGLPPAAVRAHLRACAGCRDWQADAARAGRLVRLAPAEPMPDLAPAVLAVARPLGPRRRRTAIAGGAGGAGGLARACLVAVALVQALLAWPGMLTGHDGLASGHVAVEIGAWNLALAVAFLAAASRPRTAEALVTPVAVFVAVLAVAAAADWVAGTLQAGRVGLHLLVAAGLGLLVAVSRTGRRQPEPEPVDAGDRTTEPGRPARAALPFTRKGPVSAGPATPGAVLMAPADRRSRAGSAA